MSIYGLGTSTTIPSQPVYGRTELTTTLAASYIEDNQPHTNASNCSIEMLAYIFRHLPLQGMAHCRLVSIEWNGLIWEIWIPRISENILFAKKSLALTNNLDARIQALIEMATVASFSDIQKAKDILAEAKKEAARYPNHMVALVKLIKAEISIDRVEAGLRLKHLKELSGLHNSLSLEFAYCLGKSAQLEEILHTEEKGVFKQALEHLGRVREREETELLSKKPKVQISGLFDLMLLAAEFDLFEVKKIFATLQEAYISLPIFETRTRKDLDMRMLTEVAIPALLADGDSGDMSLQDAERADQMTKENLLQVLPDVSFVEDIIKSLPDFRRSLFIIASWLAIRGAGNSNVDPVIETLMLMKNFKKGWKEYGINSENLSQKKEAALKSKTLDSILTLFAIAKIEAGYDLDVARGTLTQIHKLLISSDSTSAKLREVLLIKLIKQILRT